MQACIVILFLCYTLFSGSRCQELRCLSSLKGDKKEIGLPDSYRVSLEFVDRLKQFSADVVEFHDNKRNLSALKCRNGGQRYECIADRTSRSLIFVNNTAQPSCDVYPLDGEKSPHQDTFFIPDESTVKINRRIFSIFDFVDLINSSDSLIVDPSNRTDHDDHGIPITHLLGCKKSADGKHWLEFQICVSGKNFSVNGVDSSASVPTRIDFKVYDITKDVKSTPKTYFDATYELFGYETNLHDEDNNFLPPEGVYCHGRNSTQVMPKFPEDFSTSVEYINISSKFVDNAQLFYSKAEKLAALHFSVSNKNEPLVMSFSHNLEPGNYKVVQDFTTGLQYLTDPYSSKCVTMQGIPGNAEGTTSTMGADKRKLIMKDPFELLFTLPQKNYTYVGKRKDGEMDLNVWNAFSVENPQAKLIVNVTYELWMSAENWTREGSLDQAESFPVVFKIYRVDNFGNKNVIVRRFSNFVRYSNQSSDVVWPDFDVFDCYLPYAEYVVQMNDSMDNLKKAGLGPVSKAVHDKLVTITGLRPVRISNIKFWPSQSGKLVNMSFTVTKKSDTVGTKTDYFQGETLAADAMTKFNQTISAADIDLAVSTPAGKKYLSLRQKSLLTLRVFPTSSMAGKPLSIRTVGYTGGSMAVLAFFMLLFGGLAGVVLTYQYLKRSRGGIAYQIYE